MNKKLPYILTTLIGFIIGICAGLWVTRTPPIPAPPASVLEEVKDAPIGSDASATANIAATPGNQAALQKIRAEMDDFKTKVAAIKTSLRDQMDPLLTDSQRDFVKRWRERPAPAAPTARNFYEGFDSVITIIMVPYSLERLDANIHFTPEQKAAVRQLLLERRAKFLALVDTTPPPSFYLIKLAPPEAQLPPPAK